jgi:bifunctional pyridoxal-dependent enzyme with beta-cystathionase and maltose regulon repressor activities
MPAFRFRIVVPPEGYLAKVQALCKKHNVLLICDEIQTVRGASSFASASVPFLNSSFPLSSSLLCPYAMIY